MAPALPESLEALITHLQRLPGIGARSAGRLAHHLLRVPEVEALALAESIRTARERIRPCSQCRAPAECDPCTVCADPTRERNLLLVVETPRDLQAVEAAGSYRGLYFVLGARLSPLEGVDASALDLRHLAARIAGSEVEELCIGTNPDLEGDGTALALIETVRAVERPQALRITRLARGLPTGGQIEYQNASVLADAFDGRRPVGES